MLPKSLSLRASPIGIELYFAKAQGRFAQFLQPIANVFCIDGFKMPSLVNGRLISFERCLIERR